MTSTTKDKELYTGKASGLTFEAFDEKVITWCRKKYGDSYAVALWNNELCEIINLDLTDDEDYLAFELQCAKIYDILSRASVNNADHVYQNKYSGLRNIKMNLGKHAGNKCFAI
jgi:hypothetical protein